MGSDVETAHPVVVRIAPAHHKKYQSLYKVENTAKCV